MSARVTTRTADKDSKQNYRTPAAFIDAVKKFFGPIAFDLAAEKSNAVAKRFFDSKDDALTRSWTTEPTGLLWLNPPYKNLRLWAKKCWEESKNGANILMLSPASVGADWFRDFVARYADVYLLNGRISFDGKAPYPKDLMLSHYGEHTRGRLHLFNWRNGLIIDTWTCSQPQAKTHAATTIQVA